MPKLHIKHSCNLRRLLPITRSRFLWGILNGNIGWFTDVDLSFKLYNLMRYLRRGKECCWRNHGLDESVQSFCDVFRLVDNRWKSRVRSSFLSHLHIHITWTLPSPLIGGSLAEPSHRFPNLFSGYFWKQYPYFLPCLAAAIVILISLLVTLFFFKEVSLLFFLLFLCHLTCFRAQQVCHVQ